MLAVVGHSEDIDSADAIAEVMASCADRLGGAVPQAGLLFAGVDRDFAAMQDAVLARWPGLQLIGGSSLGEVSSAEPATEDSVALMLFAPDRVRIRAGIGTGVSRDPDAAARAAVAMACGGDAEDPSLCLLLGPGLWVDTLALVSAVQDALPPGTRLVGGMTADRRGKAERTIQMGCGEVSDDAACVLTFHGPLAVSHAVRSGWLPLGPFHRITRSVGNVVETINDRPALDLYVEYFGGHSVDFPLAIYPHEADDESFFLNVALQTEENGGLAFNQHIAEGVRVRLADARAPEIIDAAEAVAREALGGFPGARPDVGIVVSCAGRMFALGTRTREEVDRLRGTVGPDMPIIGFYSNGEVCPLAGQREARLHNCTFVSVLLGEA